MAKPPPTSFGERTIQIDSSAFGSKMASRCVWRYFVPDLDRHIPRCLRRGTFNDFAVRFHAVADVTGSDSVWGSRTSESNIHSLGETHPLTFLKSMNPRSMSV